MRIVMIATHKDLSGKILGYRLIDADSGEIRDIEEVKLISVLNEQSIKIENIELSNGQIVGLNGSIQRYPVLINGHLYGKSPLIIIAELPHNHYRVTNALGEVVDIYEQEAIKYAETEGIANGKIVTDGFGKKHISSINGTYVKDKSLKDKEYGRMLEAKLLITGNNDYVLDKNYYVRLANLSITHLSLPTGVLGIQNEGFKGATKLEKIYLPDTIEYIGARAFMGCTSLEEITIPEGVREIPEFCFAYCTNLKQVNLPNSLRKISYGAFQFCKKLKTISAGVVPIEIEYGAMLPGVRLIKRK